MTEESFQQCRKVMQKANRLRGRITTAKANVSKWTKIEQAYKDQLKESNAIGAGKMLDKAMAKLTEVREKFESMQLPDSNIIVAKIRKVQCESCGSLIDEGQIFCSECRCDDYD